MAEVTGVLCCQANLPNVCHNVMQCNQATLPAPVNGELTKESMNYVVSSGNQADIVSQLSKCELAYSNSDYGYCPLYCQGERVIVRIIHLMSWDATQMCQLCPCVQSPAHIK